MIVPGVVFYGITVLGLLALAILAYLVFLLETPIE